MTVTIELPDEIYEVVRSEAEYFGDTAQERIERMIIKMHESRLRFSRAEARAFLERIDRGEVPGDGLPAETYLVSPKGA